MAFFLSCENLLAPPPGLLRLLGRGSLLRSAGAVLSREAHNNRNPDSGEHIFISLRSLLSLPLKFHGRSTTKKFFLLISYLFNFPEQSLAYSLSK